MVRQLAKDRERRKMGGDARSTTHGGRVVIRVSARIRDGGVWGDCEFTARSFETGLSSAARKLGLHGDILTTEKVGSSQWLVNVDGRAMMVITSEVR